MILLHVILNRVSIFGCVNIYVIICIIFIMYIKAGLSQQDLLSCILLVMYGKRVIHTACTYL